jgi:hypothetical protein
MTASRRSNGAAEAPVLAHLINERVFLLDTQADEFLPESIAADAGAQFSGPFADDLQRLGSGGEVCSDGCEFGS